MKYKFRPGDFVIYRGTRYVWGSKAGRFRTLHPVGGRGSGLLVPADAVGQDVFPGPDNMGIFDERHAATYEVVRPALRLRFSTLAVGPGRHIGVLDARLEEHPSWTGPLSTKLQTFDSEVALLLVLLRRASGLLQELSVRRPEQKDEAIAAIVRMLDQMPDTVRRCFVGAPEGSEGKL